MRTLRIAPPLQLTLFADGRRAEAAPIWDGLPAATQEAVLALLARLIRAGSLEPGEVAG